MKRAMLACGSLFVLFAAHDAFAANACVAAADKGQDLRAAGKLDEARAAFLVCAKSTCNRVVRADCERWIKELDATPAPPPAPAAPVEEKEKEPAVAAPAAQPVRVSIAISEPDGGSASAPATPATTASERAPMPVGAIVLGGLGATSLAAFAFFQVQGWSQRSDLEDGCGRTRSCTDSDLESARSSFLASGVALGVSAVAIGAAAVLYFTRGSSAPSSRVGITAHGAALSF